MNKSSTLILFKDVTAILDYDRVKKEKDMFELLAATISHEMKTPLNAIISM